MAYYSCKFISVSIFIGIVAILSALIFHEKTTSTKMVEITKEFNEYILEEKFPPNFLEKKSAIVFGGTSGIGEAVAVRLARAGFRNITIVGRNAKEGARIVEAMNNAASGNSAAEFDHHHQHVKADLMFLKTCNDLVTKNEKIRANHQDSLHFVVYCQTKATLQGRTPTPAEDIDEKLALNFYSRMYLTKLLLPWMRKNKSEENKKSPSPSPRFLSILSAGMHAPYPHFITHTRLSSSLYSQKLAADITSFYTDLVFDKFAQLEQKQKSVVQFVHAAPGFVKTQWGTDFPSYLRVLIRGIQFVGGRPAEDCAEFMLRTLIEDKNNNNNNNNNDGVILCDQYGRSDQVKKSALHVEGAIEHVYKDTLDLFEEVEKKVL